MTKHNNQRKHNHLYNHYHNCYYYSTSTNNLSSNRNLVKSHSITLLLFIISIFILYFPINVTACSRMMCAPIISKCQLLEACKCDTKLDYDCFHNCSVCLGDLYLDCCSCTEVCPQDKETENSTESHAVYFTTPNEALFDILSDDEDPKDRWRVHHLPIMPKNSTIPIDCRIAYLTECVDLARCESSCISMGASGYRWFHVGCCECFGKYCTNFGINDPRCSNCPTENNLKELSSDKITQSGYTSQKQPEQSQTTTSTSTTTTTINDSL